VEVVASLSQGPTAAAQCGLFTHKSVPVIFEPPCMCTAVVINCNHSSTTLTNNYLVRQNAFLKRLLTYFLP